MKKIKLLLLTTMILIGTLFGCSSGSSAPTGTASEIADKIFAKAGVQPFGSAVRLEKQEDLEFYLGSANYPEFTDSAVILPLISIDTRVLYVLKVSNEKDADEIMVQLEEDIDPNRLVCVTFSLEDVVIDSRGNVVFMTINSDAEQRTALATAFVEIE